MKKQASFTFRAPAPLMELTKQLMAKTGMGFSEICTSALELHARHTKRNKGLMLPDFTPATMKHAEDKLGPFGPPKDLADKENKKPLF